MMPTDCHSSPRRPCRIRLRKKGNGYREVVLKLGADIDTQIENVFNKVPLGLTAIKGSFEIIRLLVEPDARVDSRDKLRWDPAIQGIPTPTDCLTQAHALRLRNRVPHQRRRIA
jgi:hypothetical protein